MTRVMWAGRRMCLPLQGFFRPRKKRQTISPHCFNQDDTGEPRSVPTPGRGRRPLDPERSRKSKGPLPYHCQGPWDVKSLIYVKENA